MILVTGGIASGKRSYVRSLGYTDDQMAREAGGDAPVLVALDETLRTGTLDDEAFAAACAKDIVVCCEVGLGVVPIDPEERAWRELVGRTCARLAEHAEQVVRMTCGIPLVLK